MRFDALSSLSLLLFSTTLAASSPPTEILEIFSWPQSASQPSPLAKIAYNTTTAILQSYTPPQLSLTKEFVRIGFYPDNAKLSSNSGAKSWSGIATSSSNFAASKEKKFQLLLTSDGIVYHLGFKASDIVRDTNRKKGSEKEKEEERVSVEVVPMKAGPSVHLNKPVVIRDDGTEEGAEPEKTFFQKYWWAIAGFFLLQIIMAGPKE